MSTHLAHNSSSAMLFFATALHMQMCDLSLGSIYVVVRVICSIHEKSRIKILPKNYTLFNLQISEAINMSFRMVPIEIAKYYLFDDIEQDVTLISLWCMSIILKCTPHIGYVDLFHHPRKKIKQQKHNTEAILVKSREVNPKSCNFDKWRSNRV